MWSNHLPIVNVWVIFKIITSLSFHQMTRSGFEMHLCGFKGLPNGESENFIL